MSKLVELGHDVSLFRLFSNLLVDTNYFNFDIAFGMMVFKGISKKN